MTKRILLATVSTLAIVGSAAAADMAAPIYKAPPPAALPTWAGFYLGLNAGAARLMTEIKTIDEVGICGDAPGATCSSNAWGATLGGQAGYNWQTGAWVYGIEGAMDWASLKHDTGTQFYTVRAKVDALGSLRAKIGFVEGSTLFYATGGGAVAHLKSGWGRGYLTNDGGCCDDQLSKWKGGWTIGGGIERMLSPNWLVKFETNYYNFGKTSLANPLPGFGGLAYRTEFKHEIIESRVGVSYKW